MYNTRKQANIIINRLIWRNEKNNILWLAM